MGEGAFLNDRMHGDGCYTFMDGRLYRGQWVQGHMSGSGSMRWADGTVYEGSYTDDVRHGTGVVTRPDGRVLRGAWVNGQLQAAKGQVGACFSDTQMHPKYNVKTSLDTSGFGAGVVLV